jgi:hypothetical protein
MRLGHLQLSVADKGKFSSRFELLYSIQELIERNKRLKFELKEFKQAASAAKEIF